ncbi:hypothetical protein CEXT_71061 [Caerostris extrusa]|uniref:Uncharacterized protein n=1 Tax=Caerostris extrusa TaxID=172846 RepID=A0AAV4MTH4_CAEEX|nr:hypothetical protein CEXT_71061 [Caerostris extrusa]
MQIPRTVFFSKNDESDAPFQVDLGHTCSEPPGSNAPPASIIHEDALSLSQLGASRTKITGRRTRLPPPLQYREEVQLDLRPISFGIGLERKQFGLTRFRNSEIGSADEKSRPRHSRRERQNVKVSSRRRVPS